MIDAGIRPPKSGYEYIYITHWHWDHVLGLASLENKTVCMHRSTIDILEKKRYGDRILEILRAGGVELNDFNKNIIKLMEEKYDKLVEGLSKNYVIPLEECPHSRAGIIAYLECPGHSIDHVCYIINDFIFVGDTLLPSRRTTIINFKKHRESIVKILGYEWKTLYPGHGDPLTRKQTTKIAKKYLIDRCNRLYRVLHYLTLRQNATVADLVQEVYGRRSDLTSFILIRTLIGYLTELEEAGFIRINKSVSPWRVELLSISSSTSSSY